MASDFSDSDGNYRVDNLTNAAYTIQPVLAGFSFSPSSLSIGGVPASSQNFSATGGGSPPTITLVSATPSSVPNSSSTTTLSVAATGSGPLAYSWDAVSAAAPVTFSVNDSSNAASTVAGFALPGNYTFRARVTDTNGLSATANTNVTVNAGPGAFVVAPYEVQTAAGQTVAFRADAWDQLGNRISLSPFWSVSGGGSIDGNGLFSAGIQGGPYFVTATSGTLSATGMVWVATGASVVAPNLVITVVGDGTYAIGGYGSSNVTYRIEFADEALGTNWQLLGSATADASGFFQLTNVVASPERFYRSVYP